MSSQERKDRQTKFTYRTQIRWKSSNLAVLSSLGKPDIETAPPPEFKGKVGFWTPEDLQVAAVNSCFLMTLLFYMNRDNIALDHYACEAEGTLEMVDKKFIVSQIKLFPRITLRKDVSHDKALSLIGMAKENCFVSNSIKANVEIIPTINYEKSA